MTTLTIDNNVSLSKTHFHNIEELYLSLQEKLMFEADLQKKAQETMNMPEGDFLDM